MRPWPLVALSLLFMAITARGDTLESNHAIIEYEPQDVAYALIVADTIDQMFGSTYQFYSGIGTMAPEPEKVPVNMDSAWVAVQKIVFDALASPNRADACTGKTPTACIEEVWRLGQLRRR